MARWGDGAICISADDPNGPSIDIFTTEAQPWVSGYHPYVRLGGLTVGVTGVSGAKQWAWLQGEPADANSPYVVLSNLQQYMYKVRPNGMTEPTPRGALNCPSGRVRLWYERR